MTFTEIIAETDPDDPANASAPGTDGAGTDGGGAAGTAGGAGADTAGGAGADTAGTVGAVGAVVDRAEVAGLLERYLLSLDDDGIELDEGWAAALFTTDAVVAFPMSRHEGRAGLAAYHRDALAAFATTQHLGSPGAVKVDGDQARLRANLMSTHVHHAHHARPQGNLPPLFTTGTFVEGTARRTAHGWRLSLLSFRVLWADGAPPPPTA